MSRKPNTLTPGSPNDILSRMAVGERRFVETTLDGYKRLQRFATLQSRRPKVMAGMQFTSTLYTAVATGRLGQICYLVCFERKK